LSTRPADKLRTLVVGGAGFIGSHLVRLLSESGRREIVVLARSPTPRFALPERVRYVAGNAGDSQLLPSLLANCDEVVDLAYASVPKTSFDDPVKDVLDNLPASVTLLQQCAHFPIKRLLLVSSGGTVYGNACSLPIDESHPTNPVSPYGITKLALEKYALMFHRLAGLPVVIVRPGNPYGPNQLGQLSQGFIGAALHAVLKRQDVAMFGQRGTVRDYLYIDDLARALLAALEHGEVGQIYNVGSGIGHDNLAVLEMLAEIVRNDGYVVKWRIHPDRHFDVAANVLNAARLTAISEWQPQIDLSRGLAMTWSWARRIEGAS